MKPTNPNRFLPKYTVSKYLIYLLVIALGSCTTFRTIIHGVLPSQKDEKYFAQRKILKGEAPFHFTPSKKTALGKTISITRRELNATNVSLNYFVQLYNTHSFLIIRNDSILFEYYKYPFNKDSLFSSFSMVKPMVSTLIGIAIDEGKINSVEDPIVTYLPEYKNRLGWDAIKIRHLLHHTSGIKFIPTSDNMKYYWGKSLRKYLLNVELDLPPDSKFVYSSINTLLLGRIIEEVTQGTVSAYLQEKIWKLLGMEANAYWSLDTKNKKQSMEKVFCCLQAKAIDFAKFGRLYLNEGNWNGKQIISKDWVRVSTTPNGIGNTKYKYNNHWELGPLKYGSYFAVGLYGQYLYMYPEKNILIVRFGDRDILYQPNYWKEIFLQIIDQL